MNVLSLTAEVTIELRGWCISHPRDCPALLRCEPILDVLVASPITRSL